MSLSVWRISYALNASLLNLGYGSTLGDGRWHTGCAGPVQMVYCGATRALCQLEKRVHCNGATPKNMALFRLELPDDAALLEVSRLGMPAQWREHQAATQSIGMQWLASGQSLGLWVPSYVEPQERNLLLNSAHADYARITLMAEKNPFVFDPRLFG